MVHRGTRRALSVALASLIGLVAGLVAASPAAAADPRAINDGAISCLINGGYAIPYHIENPTEFDIKLTSLIETPVDAEATDDLTGTVIPKLSNVLVWQIVPAGTAEASFTATWMQVDGPSVTGSFTGTAQARAFPADCVPGVSAEVTADCQQTATVELVNTTEESVIFFVGDTEHEVAGLSSETIDDVPTTSGLLSIDVYDEGFDAALPVTRFTWTEPSACTTSPATTTTGTSTTTKPAASSLANTGSSLTGLIGSGAGLVALGIALLVFLGTRRRRADAN
jgi:hypothetical protein